MSCIRSITSSLVVVSLFRIVSVRFLMSSCDCSFRNALGASFAACAHLYPIDWSSRRSGFRQAGSSLPISLDIARQTSMGLCLMLFFAALCQNKTEDAELQPYRLEIQNTEYRHKIQNTDYRIQNTDYRLQNTEYRIQNTDYRIQTTEYRLQTTDYRLQNTDYILLTTEYRP